MSYTNSEILCGVLVVVCILLLYCNYKSNVDGMSKNKFLKGLHMRDGYAAGYPGDKALSYTGRSSHFQENLENKGLNDKQTQPTPAASVVAAPNANLNTMWIPDAEIPLNSYLQDGEGNLNSHPFSPNDEIYLYKNVFDRNINRVKSEGAGSLCGSTMRYVDYGANMQPTRNLTT